MFEEEISPEELFRQFFGGGMGGGGFGGGPFGGFGMHKKQQCQNTHPATNMDHRRQRLRLQHGRWTWSQSTPNGRRHASTKTSQPREPTASLTDGRITVSLAAASTVHHSSAVITLLRRCTDISKRPLRKHFTIHPETRFHKAQSRLLCQPQRYRRLYAPELERLVRPRRKHLRPKTRNTMRMGKNAETARIPRSARLLEQRSSQVPSRERHGYACLSKAQRLGLPYRLALPLMEMTAAFVCFGSILRVPLSPVACEHFLERADDTFCIAKTYFTFDLIFTISRRYLLKCGR